MSDSEDDDEDQEVNANKQSNTSARQVEINDKKPNGINSPDTSSSTTEFRLNSTRSIRSIQRPRNSAALNMINTDETILPQRNHSTNEKNSLNSSGNHNNNRDNVNCNGSGGGGGSCSTNSKNNREKSNRSHKAPAAVQCSNHCIRSSTKRHYTDKDEVDDSPTTNSNGLNISFRNDLFKDETATSPPTSSLSMKEVFPKSSDNCPQSESPLKKRKLSINEYIEVNSNLNNATLEDNLIENSYPIENAGVLNNNETNNNDIFSIDENANNNDQLTPRKSNLNDIARINMENIEYAASSSQHLNGNSFMFTPDSGVSLNNSSTPSTIDHNDIQASTSNSTRIATYLSTCYEQSDCDVKTVNDNDNYDDEGVVVINNRKTNLNQFQQKVARVRRNYRKQFFDDTESD